MTEAPRAASRRLLEPLLQAETLVVVWETFSAVLFVSAVVPAAYDSPWPGAFFAASMVLSAALAGPLTRRGAQGYSIAAAIRMTAWTASFLPLLPSTGPRLLVAAFAFGLMAGGIRRAVYRRLIDRRRPPEPFGAVDMPQANRELGREIATHLRSRLAESAMVAGIVGGHVMLLFSVAFLRTQSVVVFRGWHDIVPVLALLGTLGFTLALRPATSAILFALRAGPTADRAILMRGLGQAEALPDVLAYVNFAFWLACTSIGVFYFRTGPATWLPGDAVMQLGFGMLFSWGVSFYQRAWHRDTCAPAARVLRRWTGAPELVEVIPLRRRMLRDFGLPLLFTAALSLLSSIGLYRALGTDLSMGEDVNAVTALFASFALLVVAVGGVVARAARDLSRPMVELAQAADLVARGDLGAVVPTVCGPTEVVGLGESVERMREALARTIDELEVERRGLEANVESRTAELRNALDELKQAQAALVQGERLASIGELVAGVAHEIYNPLNAIGGSVEPLEQLVADLRTMLDAYRAAEVDLPEQRRAELVALRASLDIGATLDDMVGISAVVRRATERSVKIVTNLKNFSRVSGEATETDLHAGLDETLMLIKARLKHSDIRIERVLGELPLVVCRSGEMNQVFMNLLTNAIHSLEGAPPPAPRAIRVVTRLDGDEAEIVIEDSGPGVPDDIRKRIFDPFFTTKPRGQGTGLGLSISTDILRRHGGTLSLGTSDLGGAKMICRLPLKLWPSHRGREPRSGRGSQGTA